MNTQTGLATRAAFALSAVVLAAGCGAAPTESAARTDTPKHPSATADGTYDGRAVRASWYSPPMSCRWSPDQVERMMESGRPLPTCVRRLQRWFREHYDPDWKPSGPHAGR
jgi:hypothetical protein